jgi:hypothetical protein
VASGTVDLLAMFNWMITQGWIASSSTLDQIDFGFEICSTSGRSATFSVDAFSITAS